MSITFWKMSFLSLVLEFPRLVYDIWRGHQNKNLEDTSSEEDVEGKVVVITGANRGLGKSIALHMARRGAVVVMACRDLGKAQEAFNEIQEQVSDANLTLVKLDLSDMSSIKSCADEIRRLFQKVDILINNAAIMLTSPKIHRTKDGFEHHLGSNYLGHALLTMLLLPKLKNGAPSRVVFVSSVTVLLSKLRLDDLNWEKSRSLQFANIGPYADSKKVMLFFANELGRRLEGTQIRVYSVWPGDTDTNLDQPSDPLTCFWTGLIRFFTGCSAEQGTCSIMYCALSKKTSRESGKAYHNGTRWGRAEWLTKDEAVALEIWLRSQELLNVSFDKHLAEVSSLQPI